MRYIEPEMEIMELEQDDIVTLSTDGVSGSETGNGDTDYIEPSSY